MIKIDNNNTIHIMIVSFFIVLFSLQYFFNEFLNIINLDNLKIELFMVYFYALIISIKRSGYVSVYSLFLILSFLFNLSRLFLELVSDYEIKYTDLFSRIILSNSTEVSLVLLLINVILFSFLSFLIFYKSGKIKLYKSLSLQFIGKYIIILLFIPLIYIYIKEFIFVLNNGYLVVFNGELAQNSSFLSVVIPRIIAIGYFIFLSSVPKEDEFKKISYIYLIILFMNALKGQRGEFLLYILFMIWYYHIIYNKKFNIMKGIKLLSFIFAFSTLLIMIRNDSEIDYLMIPYEFLRLNGISINVSAYVIELGDNIESKGISYLFSPISDYFYRIFIDRNIFYDGPTIELLNVSNNLSNHLIYQINDTAYFLGNGTGSSYLAELYDFSGVFFSGIVMFILTTFTIKIEEYALKIRYILFIAPVLIMHYIYMPRSSFFKFIDEIIILSIIYFIIYLLFKLNARKDNVYI
jgi:oligosaccharide repeat unit polymerase